MRIARCKLVAGCSGGRVGRKPFWGAGDTPASTPGFTVVELLVVMSIILVLAGLILATSSYVHNKGARSRAEAEIAAMSAALENYKADNGVYAKDTATDGTSPRSIDFSAYKLSTLILYRELSGLNTDGSSIVGAKSYFSFKPQMLLLADRTQPPSSSNPVTGIRDPFGNSYGYSTINVTDPAKGYNPTFDLWSTAGSTATGTPNPVPWIKNW